MTIELIGFDADDTLWHSESHFAVTEDRFHALVSPWSEPGETAERLLAHERANLELFGYGVKGFILSMVETAIEVSNSTIPPDAIAQIIGWGKEMMAHPVELIDGVAEVLDEVGSSYPMVLITKGDLFHQESKVAESGLADRFRRVEILSEKSPDQYRAVLERCGGVAPDQFLMVGNSVRSDVMPVVEIGGRGVHVPYRLTWSHEEVAPGQDPAGYHRLATIRDLIPLLSDL
ncbi:MAG: HAD family hydrolase [Acidimicrobiia bacterium]|nr:HAD family hydrolase [Acidimicrobiia bacterium]